MFRMSVVVALLACNLMVACTQKDEQNKAASTSISTPTPTAVVLPAPAVSSAAPTVSQEAAEKLKAIEFALREDGYKNEPLGQWAIDAKASSTFANDAADSAASYHPMRATGVPDVQKYSDAPESWASKTADAGIEWLELSYAKPVGATELRIRQSYAPGAIIKVELFDANGAAYTVFKGPDATVYEPNTIAWLSIKIPTAPYKTQRVKITLATNVVEGWNEIDAVQLVGQ